MKKFVFLKWRILMVCAVGMFFAACKSTVETAGKPAVQPLSPEEQRRYDYYYEEAVKQKILGHHDAAFSLLQYCLKLKPHAGEALYDQALYQVYLQQDSLAVAMLEQAADLEPKNIWYRETLSSFYLSRREWQKAQTRLEEMIALNPKRSDVLIRLVGLYQQNKQYEPAIKALDRIETLEGKSLQVSMDKFWMYQELKQKEKGFQELESLAKEYPNDLSYQVLIGSQYLAVGEKDKAKQILDEVQQKEPDNMVLRQAWLDYYKATKNDSLYQVCLDSLLMGKTTDENTRVRLMRDYVSEQEQKKTDSAVVMQKFRQLLAGKQEHPGMLMLFAAYQELKQDSPEHREMTMKRILDIEPDNKMALQELMKLYIKNQSFQKLVALCDKGIQYYPDLLVFYYYKGLSLYQLDQSQKALEAFEMALKQDKSKENAGIISEIFSITGDLYHELGRKAESYAAYDSALVYKSDNLGCLNNYAYFLSLEKKDLDRAGEMSYKTIQKEPQNVTYLDTYAWILFLKRNYQEAKVYMDKILAIWRHEPENEEGKLNREMINGGVLEHIGDVYFQCGQKEEALALWLEAQQQKEGVSDLLEEKIKQKKYLEP